MNKNKEKVPKIRFPGFTEPWEQRKLGDVVSYIVDNRGKIQHIIVQKEYPLSIIS